ncbi:sensor histidine kinase [Streptacidiphilus sp. EB103A]|uniref:sensor histidine kinase n=1 Tax=Streptacidiphilus sp. EB103A TaxID=3156275 RepID=UPI0035133BEC
MADRMAAALLRWVRRPTVQDAALACGLLLTCVLLNDPGAMVDAAGGRTAAWSWWAATAFLAAGVTLRRRWPLPMLALCTVSAAVHLAQGEPPMVIDACVLVLLCTVAARRRRIASRSALAALLLLVTGWSVFDALQGRPALGLPSLVFQISHRLGPSTGGSQATVADRSGGSNPWSGLVVLGSMLVASWAVGNGVRDRRAYLGQLHARARDLERERDQQAALAVAAERGRISRELHDVVAHGLSVIVIQAQGADAALDNRPADTRTALQAIVRTGRDSLADMRRMITALGEVDDAWHPQPGLAQLPTLLSQVRRAGTPVRLRVEGEPAALAQPVDLSAYRIVQEALTNAMKHAAGATAQVLLSYGDAEVGIEISDDGRGMTGIDGTSGDGTGGNGLRGMRERVALLGGRLSAGPGSDGGFVVRATLPFEGRGA